MSIEPLSDAKIVESWHRNAEPWTAAVRESRIESRTLVTNHAIIDAVLSRHPKSMLDIGCGEGCLVRALAERNIRALGVDVVPDLVDKATRAGGGEFRVASYEMIAAGQLDVSSVDVVVCNFSLLGKESVDDLTSRSTRERGAGGGHRAHHRHCRQQCGWRAAPRVCHKRSLGWSAKDDVLTADRKARQRRLQPAHE